MIFKHKEIKITPFKQEDIYGVVADVDQYPIFVPWLSQVNVLNRYDNTIEYELAVDFKVIKEKFSTKDVFTKPNKIEIFLIKGPFKYLYNVWNFYKIDDNNTEIIFEIEFEFKSKFISLIFSKLFIEAQKKIIQSFEDRAKELFMK